MVITKEPWVVDQALAVVLWVSRLYGIVPLSFQFRRTSTITCISLPIYFFGVLLISLINLIVLADLVYEPEAVAGTLPASKNNNRLLATINTLITVTTTMYCSIYSVFKIKRYLLFTSEINKIKNSLNNYSYASGPKLWHAICLLSIFLFELLILPLVDITEYGEWSLFVTIYMTANFTLYGALGMMVLQFVFVALHINSSFQVINKCLADVLSEIRQESKAKPFLKNDINFKMPINSINKAIDLLGNMKQDFKMAPRLKLARKIRALSNSFAQTSEVLRDLNDTENIYLLVHVVVITMYLVITLNNLVQASCCSSDLKNTGISVMLECFWFACHTFRIALIVEPCHRIQEELSQTKMLVGYMICEVMYEEDPLFNVTDNFFKQLHLNDISITVMGIFSLERSTISTIIGGAATLYVVLLEL